VNDRSGNQTWQRVVAAATPSPDERAQVESVLAAIDAAPPLPEHQIEHILEVATGTSGGVVAPRRRRRATRFATAVAAALLCSVFLGWIGTNWVWPRQASLLTLDSFTAIECALEAGGEDRQGAFNYLNNNCWGAIGTLELRAGDRDPDVAAAAIEARGRHGSLMAAGRADIRHAAPHLETTERDAEMALDTTADARQRIAAVARLGDAAAAATAVIHRAPLPDGPGGRVPRLFVERLSAALARPPGGPATAPRESAR
jgi:hypothetical protein